MNTAKSVCSAINYKLKLDLMLLASVFIVTRIIAYCIGLRFDIGPLDFYWQLADPLLLKTKLAETLLYSHSQPPLYNLLAGLGLKFFGSNFGFLMGGIFYSFSLLSCLSIYGLLFSFDVRRWLGLAAVLFYMHLPYTILMENWFFYEQLLSTFLLLGLLFSRLYFKTSKFSFATLALYSFMLCSLTTASFGLPWLLILSLIFLNSCRKKQLKVSKLLLASLLVPTLIVMTLHLKNFLVFGVVDISPTNSVQNLVFASINSCSANELKELRKSEVISDAYKVVFFSNEAISNYSFDYKYPSQIETLTRKFKSTGFVNTNYYGYLAICDLMSKDFINSLLFSPNCFLTSMREGLKRYFLVAGDHWPFFESEKNLNYELLLNYQSLLDKYLWIKSSVHHRSYTLIVLLPLSVLLGLYSLTRKTNSPLLDKGTIIIILFTILYTFLVMLISSGEQNRYRARVDSFYLVLVVTYLNIFLDLLLGSANCRFSRVNYKQFNN